MLYLWIILISIVSVGTVDGMLLGHSVCGVADGIFTAALAAVAVIAIDGAGAFAVRRLPESWFLCENIDLGASKNERRLYRSLKINSWKEYVPELGGFTNFHKDKILSISDTEYLSRFILESNFGVVIHFINAITGVLICFIPRISRPSIWIPVFLVNFVLSILPMMILRYNLPVLKKLYLRAKKRSADRSGII